MFEMLNNIMNTYNDTMKALEGQDEMQLALLFTLLDTTSAYLKRPTMDILKEYMPIIESVNNDLGAMQI